MLQKKFAEQQSCLDATNRAGPQAEAQQAQQQKQDAEQALLNKQAYAEDLQGKLEQARDTKDSL